MATYKSPFFIQQEFISPLMCGEILDYLNFTFPNVDKDSIPEKTMKHSQISEEIIFERFIDLVVPKVQDHYEIQYNATEKIMFEWYPTGCPGEKPHAENSSYIKGKWVRNKPRDFTCVLFFSDYENDIIHQLDVYGGKLEFPQHDFGFNPEKGTLIVFPSGPYFINATTKILVGNLIQARFHIHCQLPYVYNPEIFPGDYREWFKKIA